MITYTDMKRVFPIFSAALLLVGLAGAGLLADEVVLLEGKVISGKIMGETGESITIMTGRKMVLTINKTKIKDIIREGKPKPKVTEVTLEEVSRNAVKPSSAPAVSTPAPAAVASKPAPPEKEKVPNPQAGSKLRDTAKDNVWLHELVVTKIYRVKGSTQSEIASDIYDAAKGKGFPTDRGRLASQTKMEVDWLGQAENVGGQFHWKKLTVNSTSTLTMPYWEAPAKFAPEVAQRWGEFLKALDAHANGELKIYTGSLVSLAAGLAQLQAPTEKELRTRSQALVKQTMDRAEKQKVGFNRTRRLDGRRLLEK